MATETQAQREQRRAEREAREDVPGTIKAFLLRQKHAQFTGRLQVTVTMNRGGISRAQTYQLIDIIAKEEG